MTDDKSIRDALADMFNAWGRFDSAQRALEDAVDRWLVASDDDSSIDDDDPRLDAMINLQVSLRRYDLTLDASDLKSSLKDADAEF